jgi:hypothetical protein
MHSDQGKLCKDIMDNVIIEKRVESVITDEGVMHQNVYYSLCIDGKVSPMSELVQELKALKEKERSDSVDLLNLEF